MSHKISMTRAKRLYENEQKLRQIQSEGKQLPSSRRQKKYLLRIKKEKGFFKYLAARHKLHGHSNLSSMYEEMAGGNQ